MTGDCHAGICGSRELRRSRRPDPLLLLRVAETAIRDTWRNLRNELDRMHLVTLATNEGTVAQRTELTHGQRRILKALELPDPTRFYDFTPTTGQADSA